MDSAASTSVLLYVGIIVCQVLLSLLFSRYIQIPLFRIVLALPLLLFVLLGPNVGTDAAIYRNYYEDVYRNGCSSFELEPLFCLITWFFSSVFGLDAVRNLLAVVIWTLLVFVKLQSRASYLYLFSIYIPVFFIDAAMNGVRQGLALSLFTFIYCFNSTQDLRSSPKSHLSSISLLLTAVVHQSMLFAFALYNKLNLVNPATRRILIVLALATIGFLAYKPPSFLLRIFSYSSSFDNLSLASGLPTLICIAYQLYLAFRFRLISLSSCRFLIVVSLSTFLLSKMFGLYFLIRLLNMVFLLVLALPLLLSYRVSSFSLSYYSLISVLIFWTLRIKDFYTELSLPVLTPFLHYSL